MKTADLPLSENVEDRRGEKPMPRRPMTIAEALALSKGRVPRSVAEPIQPDATSQLAKDAGADDIVTGSAT